MQKDEYTINEYNINVGDGHKLYIQDWGNIKSDKVIVFLHGGPGSCLKDYHKNVFDPLKHRIVFFDQRGCGHSTAVDPLSHNTTQDLISDINKITNKLSIEKFYIYGTSWGSTLALAYTVLNSDKVLGLIIGGVFLGSKEESDWISKGQFAHFFPDVWEAYLERTPKEYKLNPTAYHLDMIFNGNEEDKKRSAYAYACLNMGVMRLDDRYNTENYDEFIPSGMWIEMHYASNGYFMPDNYILNNTGKLTMPIYIVQGRYDMLCPPGVAYKLSKGLANCQIYWTTSNHSTEHEDYNVFKSILANL